MMKATETPDGALVLTLSANRIDAASAVEVVTLGYQVMFLQVNLRVAALKLGEVGPVGRGRLVIQ